MQLIKLAVNFFSEYKEYYMHKNYYVVMLVVLAVVYGNCCSHLQSLEQERVEMLRRWKSGFTDGNVMAREHE